MTEEEYQSFWEALTTAQEAEVHGFEDAGVFEGCMPVEVMARRGRDTLCYGPLKPVGLKDPKTGREPFAVVQLRRTTPRDHLQHCGLPDPPEMAEQKRVFSMIPALRNAEYVRYGVMHRNTFLDSPAAGPLFPGADRAARPLAGQITGVEGYVESTASGCLAALELARSWRERAPSTSPGDRYGGHGLYISDPSVVNFQPMNVNFGLIPAGLSGQRQAEQNAELSKRALEALGQLDLE